MVAGEHAFISARLCEPFELVITVEGTPISASYIRALQSAWIISIFSDPLGLRPGRRDIFLWNIGGACIRIGQSETVYAIALGREIVGRQTHEGGIGR